MVVLACVYWLYVRRRRPRAPEPLLLSLLVGLFGLIAVPADLEIGQRGAGVMAAATVVGGLLAPLAVYAVMRTVSRRSSPLGFRRVIRAATVPAVLVTIVSGIVFVQSPLFGPASYRVPPGRVWKEAGSRPHVLWIVLDTLRPDRTSCYGYPGGTTPFLEECASESIVFERAVANDMWTVPSHASMFTGLSVREHGTDHPNIRLDEAFPTVAGVLAKNGYTTASFSGNPWISRTTNLVSGFETAQVVYELRHLTRFSLEYLGRKWGINPLVPWLDRDFGAATTNHMIDRWLNTDAAKDNPVFLFVNYMEAHLPYWSPRQYRRLYMTDDQVDRSYDLCQSVHGPLVWALALRFNVVGGDFLAADDRKLLKRQYEAALRYLDDRVRELIGMFEERGLLDNTLVVIASDHGEHLDTHGLWAHRMQLWEDTTHVCLMIRPPRGGESVRVSTPVLLSDLHQTVLNAALGLSDDGPGVGSRDLLAVAAAGARMSRVVVSEYVGAGPETRDRIRRHNPNDPVVAMRALPQIAAQDGRFKYIVSANGRRELYDLQADPGELHNLIDTHPAQAQRLADALDQWYDDVPVYQPSTPAVTAGIDHELSKSLRSLGYLDEE